MAEEEVDPRLGSAVRSLAQKMASFCTGRPLDQQLVSDVMGIYEDHRTRARLAGIDFPEMVLLILDEQKQLRFVRRNLTPQQIDVLIQDVYTVYKAPADEIARAIRRAFPHHRPPDDAPRARTH
jgi:hypothetical protein